MGGKGSGTKPRDYPTDIVRLACRLYQSGLTVSEIRAVFPKGYRVQTILERYLPERRPTAKRNQRGPRNHMWSGAPGYQAAHLRVASEQGPASSHPCVDCGSPAQEWSYTYTTNRELRDPKSGCAYSLSLSDYVPRCRSCHRCHDARKRREVVPYV